MFIMILCTTLVCLLQHSGLFIAFIQAAVVLVGFIFKGISLYYALDLFCRSSKGRAPGVGPKNLGVEFHSYILSTLNILSRIFGYASFTLYFQALLIFSLYIFMIIVAFTLYILLLLLL